jgi:hypothetical protein
MLQIRSAKLRRYVGIGVILAVVLVASVSLDHGRARATSSSEAASSQAVPGFTYTAPTGPEMEPAQIQELAVALARQSGVNGALKLSIAHATAREGNDVLNGESPKTQTATVEGAWESVPSYVVVMEAPAGEYFSPDDPEPPGAAPIHQKYWAVVMDSQDGQVTGGFGGPTPPKIEELGPVITSTVPALRIVAEKSEPANGGIIVWLKPSHVGWPVNVTRVGSHWSITRKYTTEGARFRFLHDGEFIVDARKCGSRRVHLPLKKYVNVTLDCH